MAAQAIYFAAHARRREINVGLPTLIAIYGNGVAPALADWYLARYGYDAQQTSEPAPPERQDNLWAPVAGDHGAHGAFDDRAKSFSMQSWINQNRWIAALGVVGTALLWRGLKPSPYGARAGVGVARRL